LELRADLLFGFNSVKNKAKDTLIGTETQITKNASTLFGLNLGANYHFKGTERISPYLGALIGIGVLNASTKITNLGYVSDNYSSAKRGGLYMDFTAVTGFNWYIVSGLYVGAEIGLGIEFAKELKSTMKSKVAGTETTITVDPTGSVFGVNFYANPAIRLGWKF
jgi:hypothetical protein